MTDKLIVTNRYDILENISAVVGQKTSEEHSTGGKINLIRAVYDYAQDEIDSIDEKLERLEVKKNELLKEKAAHIEMLAVAQKHISPKIST